MNCGKFYLTIAKLGGLKVTSKNNAKRNNNFFLESPCRFVQFSEAIRKLLFFLDHKNCGTTEKQTQKALIKIYVVRIFSESTPSAFPYLVVALINLGGKKLYGMTRQAFELFVRRKFFRFAQR